MNEQTTTIADLKKLYKDFVDERDWNQFHSPKNLSMDISVEAAELMELFLWCDSDKSRELMESESSEFRHKAEDELVDVLMAVFCFANNCNIDLTQAIESKMAQNRKKYPVEKAKGNATKYTEY